MRPIQRRIGGTGPAVRLLSATDSCRDRLAAFYHWNDRQSLDAAVQIALKNRIAINRIREWSGREGATERFIQFVHELTRARSNLRRPARTS